MKLLWCIRQGSYLPYFASLRNLDHMLVWPIISLATKYQYLTFHKGNTDRISEIISEFVFERNPYVTLDVPTIYVMIRDGRWLIACNYIYHVIENEAARIFQFYWRSKFNFDPWIPSICKQLQRVGSIFTNIIQSFVPHMYVTFFRRCRKTWFCNEF